MSETTRIDGCFFLGRFCTFKICYSTKKKVLPNYHLDSVIDLFSHGMKHCACWIAIHLGFKNRAKIFPRDHMASVERVQGVVIIKSGELIIGKKGAE